MLESGFVVVVEIFEIIHLFLSQLFNRSHDDKKQDFDSEKVKQIM